MSQEEKSLQQGNGDIGGRDSKVAELLKEDAKNIKLTFRENFRRTIRQPITQLIAVLGMLFVFGLDYAVGRILSAVWEVDPPEEVVKLNHNMKNASNEIHNISKKLVELGAQMKQTLSKDPKLNRQFEALNTQLEKLQSAVAQSSSAAEKMAILSESLRADWLRLKESSRGVVDGVPDVILKEGEAVQVCDSLSTLGFLLAYGSSARTMTVAGSRYLEPGQRVFLDKEKGAYVDFIGLSGKQAKYKINCGRKK